MDFEIIESFICDLKDYFQTTGLTNENKYARFILFLFL